MTKRCLERFSHSLDTLCPCRTLICAFCNRGQTCFSSFGSWSLSLTAALEFQCECFLSSCHHSKFSLMQAQQVCFTIKKTTCYTMWLLLISWSRHKLASFDYLLAVWLFSTLYSLPSSKGKFHADSSVTCMYLDRSNSPDCSLSLLIQLLLKYSNFYSIKNYSYS